MYNDVVTNCFDAFAAPAAAIGKEAAVMLRRGLHHRRHLNPLPFSLDVASFFLNPSPSLPPSSPSSVVLPFVTLLLSSSLLCSAFLCLSLLFVLSAVTVTASISSKLFASSSSLVISPYILNHHSIYF
ncbi:hypothetical protein AAHE18_07G087100 [Arachis hypogaea]